MIYQQLEETALLHKDKDAIVTMNGKLTFYQLLVEIQKYCCLMKDNGIVEGSVVVVYSNNDVEYIVALFAIAKLGAIFVPIDNIRLTEFEKDTIIKAVIPSFIIKFTDEKELVILQLKNVDKSNEEEENPIRKLHKNEFTILFSSGTTGVPKGIVHTQYSRWSMFNNLTATFCFTDTDIHLCTIVLTSPHSIGICILPSLLNGSTLHIISPEKVFPRTIAKYIYENKITIYTSLPMVFSSMLKTKSICGEYFESIRQILSGGAALSYSLGEQFTSRFGVRLGNIYGLAEHGPVFVNKTEFYDVPYNSIGKPVNGVEVRIWDENNKIVTRGEVGEIRVRSKSKSKGYWNNEEETKKVFLEDGWIATKDYGYCDECGNYYITGRESQFINVNSNKVSPDEIEHVLLEYPDLLEAAVFGIEVDEMEEIIVACIKVEKLKLFNMADFKNYYKSCLASYKQPREIKIINEIPKNSYGKILKNILRDKYFCNS